MDKNEIKSAARAVGFDLCGVAPSRALEEQRPRLERWLAEGRHGGLGYMARGTERRIDPSQSVPGARTVIVCAVSYNHGAHLKMENAGVRVASYALASDYHDVVGGMLSDLVERLPKGIAAGCFVDSSALLEKAWAVEAGLGWRGRNSLLVTPEHGSFLILGEIITDMVVDSYDKPYSGSGCGECRRCMDVCPAGAIYEPGMVDARKCISRLTIEKSTGGDGDARLYGWIFGCDECQNACPYNRRPLSGNPALAPVIDPSCLTAEFWRSMTPEKFDSTFGHTPLTRAGLERLVAQIE